MFCKYCNLDYPEDHFHIALEKNSKVYRRKKCKFCYSKTKSLYHNYKRSWYREFKKTLHCNRCGFADYKALQFHHKENNKLHSVSFMIRSYSIENIKTEISKCEVVCANCHFIEHYDDFNITSF